MEKRFLVKVELSAGEMAAVLRAVEKVRLEEWCVCYESREWSNLCDAGTELRLGFASALSGNKMIPDDGGMFRRRLSLVDKWQKSGECISASLAAAKVRIGKVA